MRTVLRFAVTCWVIAAAVAAHAENIRVMPQFGWEPEGVLSSDGRLGACIVRDSTVYVVDAKRSELVWRISLPLVCDLAFSADGKRLAASGGSEGFLLETESGRVTHIDDLKGGLVSFTPDSEHIVLAQYADFPYAGGRFSTDFSEIVLMDLKGRPVRSFPLYMTVPEVLEFDPEGALEISGLNGDPSVHVPHMSVARQ